MSSPASIKYASTVGHIQTLRKAATDKKLRPMSRDEIQVYYHAALTAHVAAWNAYIKNLVLDFYDAISDPSDPKFRAIYTITRQRAENALSRYNTPNSENTRNILVQFTGYDPIGDWGWKRHNMSGVQVRSRLDETLHVRHSFAHSFAMPSYVWTLSPSGKTRLTSKVIQETEAFFRNLVKVTDRGMKEHIELTYGLSGFWQV